MLELVTWVGLWHVSMGGFRGGEAWGPDTPTWKITSSYRLSYKFLYGPPRAAIAPKGPNASRGRSVHPSVKYIDGKKTCLYPRMR